MTVHVTVLPCGRRKCRHLKHKCAMCRGTGPEMRGAARCAPVSVGREWLSGGDGTDALAPALVYRIVRAARAGLQQPVALDREIALHQRARQFYRGHPNLLPAAFDDGSALPPGLVRKPLHSREGDVPPVLSSMAIWSPIPNETEIGREEALFRRADHRLPA
ncbi:hypothetical protein [Xanthomonas medicagonis]|uniref:hypothetical protein n=1 Tax=Xanthomonas medicagonis TaxID=3160841 RepID=UPI00351684AF